MYQVYCMENKQEIIFDETEDYTKAIRAKEIAEIVTGNRVYILEMN